MSRKLAGLVLALCLIPALAPAVMAASSVQALTVGSNSCTGPNACTDAAGPIGDNSCNGDSACENTDGAIGNGSCNGPSACTDADGPIGNYSCNDNSQECEAAGPLDDCVRNDYTPVECVQPDGSIRRSGGPRAGDDIYNLDATGQTIDGGPRAYRPGSVRWFYVYFENDGMVPDSFTVMGCHQDETTLQGIEDDPPGYSVAFYRPSGANITAVVEAGTFTTPVLDPGEHWAIRARVQIGPGAPHGSEFYRLFTITSVDNGAKQDSVKFEVGRS